MKKKDFAERIYKELEKREKADKKVLATLESVFPNKNIEATMRNEVDVLQKMFKVLDRPGFHPMVNVFFLDDNNEVERALLAGEVFGEDWNNGHDGRIKELFKVGMKLGESQSKKPIIGAMLATECWYAKTDKKELPDTPVSQMPDKKEAITIMFETADARTASALIDIKRDKKNNIGLTKKVGFIMPDDKGDKVESNMIKALFEGYHIGQVKAEMGE